MSMLPIPMISLAQVRQPVYTRSVARWRKYEAELGELFAVLPGGQGEGLGSG